MVECSPATLDAVFHALADPTRRSILRDVSGEEKTVNEIARPYRMSLAAVSKHLQVLEDADLIWRERKGNFRMVRLKADKLRSAQEWLAWYERFWNVRLDALQKLVEETETSRKETK